MVQTVLFRILWLIVLVLVQVLVLNNVNLFGYITPYLYIYLILKMEVEESRNSVMLWSFACGLLVDTFSNTPGLNAAASVLLAFVRIYILRLFASRDSIEQGAPSIRSLGLATFSKYVAVSVFLHHTALVWLSYFTLSSFGDISIRIILSSLFTIIFILLIDNVKK